MAARKTLGLWTGEVSELRAIAGAIAADSATLTDANFPASAAVNCAGFDTIFIGVEIVAGSSPTMTIECLFRDDNAADGLRWKRVLLGARDGITALGAVASETTGALDGTSFVEMRVYGHDQVFFRVTAVANSASTTSSKILGMPGRTRNVANLQRS